RSRRLPPLSPCPYTTLFRSFVALVLTIGGMAVLYFTPLYVATTTRPGLHLFVHLHFVVAGYLFAWVVAGPDPAPDRPSVPVRLRSEEHTSELQSRENLVCRL